MLIQINTTQATATREHNTANAQPVAQIPSPQIQAPLESAAQSAQTHPTAGEFRSPTHQYKQGMTPLPKTRQTFSLMLNEAEEKNTFKQNPADTIAPDPTTCFYLGGILHADGNRWVFWLNDRMYNEDAEIEGLKVINISDEEITFKHKHTRTKNGIKLQIHHTFCTDTGHISSGDHRR